MKRENEIFNLKLTDKELGIIEDSLEISKAFKVYGEGRDAHQNTISKLIQKLYTEAWN